MGRPAPPRPRVDSAWLQVLQTAASTAGLVLTLEATGTASEHAAAGMDAPEPLQGHRGTLAVDGGSC